MRILALDTSFNTGTVAIVDGEEILVELSFYAERAHGERSMQALEAAFALSDAPKDSIDLVAVGVGPGGFTSVRVGIATAKGLALARDLPIVGISSLLGLARSVAPSGGLVAAIQPAGRGEHFGALYELSSERGPARTAIAPRLGKLEALEEDVIAATGGRDFTLVGASLPSKLALPGGSSLIRGSAIAFEAKRVYEAEGPSDLDALAPLYLRESDAKLPKQKLRDPSTIP